MMTPDRWLRMQKLFDRALALPESSRAEFLRQRCGPDTALRRRVEGLLRADRRAGSFLAGLIAHEAPANDPEASRQGKARAGPRIGPYHLLRKLGEGGMGSVYLAARDGAPFRREVVLKLIRRGMENAQTRSRLRTEMQILATLEHPHIARLYDGGTTRDQTTGEDFPYFVMERVEGLPIDVFCDQHQLSISDRLELFRKVCSVVHYAHQHLIVHRDLKPSNILVTGAGEPKLLDFGIAKLLDPDSLGVEAPMTAAWDRWLTPNYASPEQIRGQRITTASDVYALGVLLFKLLTGCLPYRFDNLPAAEIERRLSEEPAPRPSEAVRTKPGGRSRQRRLQLLGDLDTIVSKALQLRPQRRYRSAEQLSEDLQRYLGGFPLSARPDRFFYRFGKFLRRHRLAMAISSAFVVLLTLGVLALAGQSARIARERDQLRTVISFVKEVFRVAAEGEDLTVRQAVDRSAAILERKLHGQPEVRATLIDTTGTIYLNLWALDQARAQFEQAVEIRRRLHGDRSVAAAESLSSLGLTLAYQGDVQAGEVKARQALQWFRHQYGAGHRELVRPLNKLVNLLCYKGDYGAAEEPSIEALALARQHLADESEELATAVANRALLLAQQGRAAEAAELYREALDLLRRSWGDRHPEIAAALNNLALVMKRLERFDEAEDLYRQALALERQLFGRDNAKVAVTLNNLASLLLARDHAAAAIEMYTEARQITQNDLGPGHQGVLIVSAGLASALIRSGDPVAAENLLRAGLGPWRASFGGSWLIAYAESILGESLAVQGRYQDAEELLLASYPTIRQAQGERSPKARDAVGRIVALYRAWGKPEKQAEYEALLSH